MRDPRWSIGRPIDLRIACVLKCRRNERIESMKKLGEERRGKERMVG